MRRRAEIAKHTTQGAHNALLAAHAAADESVQVALTLSIDPADVRAICAATRLHKQRIDDALRAIEAAVQSAVMMAEVVDRAEISRLGIPILRSAADGST
jgi:hypothetical protein